MSLLDLFNSNSPESALTFVEPDQSLIAPPAPPPQIRLLRIFVAPERSFLLPLSQIKGVHPIHRVEILPIPDMAFSVLGTLNWRGEFIWLIDLGYVLGYAPLDLRQKQDYMSVIVHHQEQVMGIVIPQVEEIEDFELGDFLPPLISWIPSNLHRYAQGYIRSSGDIVLQISALISDPVGGPRPT